MVKLSFIKRFYRRSEEAESSKRDTKDDEKRVFLYFLTVFRKVWFSVLIFDLVSAAVL